MKRVLVTGASKGIGRGIARKLADEGWSVAVHYNTDQAGAESLGQILGENLAGLYQANLGVQDQALRLFEKVTADGEVSALVNNAGIYDPADFCAGSDEEFLARWDHTLTLNLVTPMVLSRHALMHFMERGAGKILNVASRVGFRGEPGAATYAATKAGLINLTRSLAVEMAPRNIQVFGIAPGWVETAMTRDGMAERAEEIKKSLPLGRLASVEDCANAAAFLLSDDAAYLSGQVIDINGASYFH